MGCTRLVKIYCFVCRVSHKSCSQGGEVMREVNYDKKEHMTQVSLPQRFICVNLIIVITCKTIFFTTLYIQKVSVFTSLPAVIPKSLPFHWNICRIRYLVYYGISMMKLRLIELDRFKRSSITHKDWLYSIDKVATRLTDLTFLCHFFMREIL